MPVRVLLVDDDTLFRDTMSIVLIDRGYDVVGHAATLSEARVAVGELDPDVLLLDVNLPDGNGILFAQELTARTGAPRVVLTSSDRNAAPTRLIRRSGAAGFIAKTELMAADLRRHLG